MTTVQCPTSVVLLHFCCKNHLSSGKLRSRRAIVYSFVVSSLCPLKKNRFLLTYSSTTPFPQTVQAWEHKEVYYAAVRLQNSEIEND